MILSLKVHGQFNISGRIYNKQDAPISFATISLMKDSTHLQSTISDSLGHYKFINTLSGKYLLRVNYLGEKLPEKTIYLSKDTIVNIVFVSDRVNQLQEVTVTGRKPLFERKVDRLVFNVENSPALQGLDASEALANTPMLNTNDGGISIVGKSGVGIMINERLLHLSGKELMNYLKSLRSDDIAKIEIITTPPARYDAQGNSGLINIVLKKNPNLGWSGTLSSTYIKRTYGGMSNNAAINFQSNKVSLSTNLRHYDVSMHSVENYSIVGNVISTSQHDSRKDFNDGVGANVSLDYKINKASNLGFIYDGSIGHANMDISSATSYFNKTTLDSNLSTNSAHRQSINFQTANVYYDLNLDTIGRKLSISANYLTNAPKNPVNFTTKNLQTGNEYTVRNESDVSYRIYSGQGDLTFPFQEIQFETGVKYTDISNNSDVRYLNKINDVFLQDDLKSNRFQYNERNYAAYISASRDLSELWSAKAGLRYEYSQIKGFSPTTDESTRSNYGNLFPSLYLMFKPNKDNAVSMNYSRRINRPGFSLLNPFKWYSNPYTYFTGNPQLQPSYNNNVELAYVYKDNLSVTLYNQNIKDGYSQLSLLENTTKVSTWENHLVENYSGLSLTYSFNKIKWLQSSMFTDLYFIRSSSSIQNVVGQRGLSFYYQLNNTIFLNSEQTFMFLLNYWQNLPRRSGNLYSYSTANLRAGFNILLFDKKLQLNLMGEDIFTQTLSRGKLGFTDNNQYFNNYYDARRLTIGITYRYGNNKVKGNNKNMNFEEKSRAN